MTAPRPPAQPLHPASPLLESDPIERAETIPSSWYTDPAFDALDRGAVFARTWQAIGHAAQVAEPGQYFTATIAGDPVLVLRDGEGVLRAFYNVCRHRGGPLAMEPEGRCKALTCKYHGWTYRLDGTLRGVPRWNLVELFDKKDYGLIPLRIDVWEGLVFVRLDAGSGALEDLTGGITERIAPIRLGSKRFGREVVYEVACNWKVYVDNYLEGYHVPYVHPELMKLYDFESYTTETFDRYSLQWSRLAPGDNLYSAAEGDCAFYYFLFPNCMLNILPGRLQTNLVEPLGPDRCRVVFRYFYDDVDSPAARQLIAADLDYSDRVQAEDREICEHVQRGLGSRGYDRGRFSVECEQGVYHFQQLLKRCYRTHLEAAAPGPVPVLVPPRRD